jgi:hypothetical protein
MFDSDLNIDSKWTHKIRSFIVLLDSTHSKDSNEILFVKFGQVFYFLSILQDAVAIWNLNSNFEKEIDWIDRGADWAGDVARRYRPAPIR